MTTIKDIAKAAGVAQGTVSNVLNGKGNVSSEKIRQDVYKRQPPGMPASGRCIHFPLTALHIESDGVWAFPLLNPPYGAQAAQSSQKSSQSPSADPETGRRTPPASLPDTERTGPPQKFLSWSLTCLLYTSSS